MQDVYPNCIPQYLRDSSFTLCNLYLKGLNKQINLWYFRVSTIHLASGMSTMAGGMGASVHLSIKFQSWYLLWSQINELGTSHIPMDIHRLIFNHTQKCKIIFIKWILITCVIIETDFKQGNPENIPRETITLQSCVTGMLCILS